MAEFIKTEAAIAIIEEKQKELCPVGRYGRGYVYGSDREKYDAWDEIIDALENIPAADVAPVVHARFVETERPIRDGKSKVYGWECTACKRFTRSPFVDSWEFCPNCGAKMDGGDGNEAD